MEERYPNLKVEFGGLIPGCEISSLLDKPCQVVNCLLCFGIGMSAFCLQKKLNNNNNNDDDNSRAAPTVKKIMRVESALNRTTYDIPYLTFHFEGERR